MLHKIFLPTSFSQHYEKLETDESGSFGKVYKVCHMVRRSVLITRLLQDYKTNMAVKIIKTYPLSGVPEGVDCYLSHTYKSIRREIDKILYFKPHPHIAQILGVLCNPYGIVLELAPVGDLQSAIIDNYRYRDNFLCSTAILLTIKQVFH